MLLHKHQLMTWTLFLLLWLLMLIERLNLWSRLGGSQHQPPIACLIVFTPSQNQRCLAGLLQNIVIDVRKSAGSDGLPVCAKDLAQVLWQTHQYLTHVRWAAHSLETGDSQPRFQEWWQARRLLLLNIALFLFFRWSANLWKKLLIFNYEATWRSSL